MISAARTQQEHTGTPISTSASRGRFGGTLPGRPNPTHAPPAAPQRGAAPRAALPSSPQSAARGRHNPAAPAARPGGGRRRGAGAARPAPPSRARLPALPRLSRRWRSAGCRPAGGASSAGWAGWGRAGPPGARRLLTERRLVARDSLVTRSQEGRGEEGPLPGTPRGGGGGRKEGRKGERGERGERGQAERGGEEAVACALCRGEPRCEAPAGQAEAAAPGNARLGRGGR